MQLLFFSIRCLHSFSLHLYAQFGLKSALLVQMSRRGRTSGWQKSAAAFFNSLLRRHKQHFQKICTIYAKKLKKIANKRANVLYYG